MNSGNLRKKIFRNIIIASFIISLMISVFPAFASAATIQYTYDDTGQVTTATYDDTARIGYTYDNSGNRLTKAATFFGNISIAPLSVNFGEIHARLTSPPQTVTVTNTGSGTLAVGITSIGGANPLEFAKTSDTCSNTSVQPLAACQIQAVFQPSSAGAKSATLAIPSDDPVTPGVDITLSGTGLTAQYILTVSKTGTGTGTVTSNPSGINCGSDCTEPYDEATPVTLTAQSLDGCTTFTGWSGGECSGTGTCIVTMNADTTVTATFNIITPVADFSAAPLLGPSPLTVNFTDLSSCPTSWSWDFGDTGTSTTQNPSHTYNPQFGSSFAVSYTVALTATNVNSSNTLTKTSYITAQCPNLPVKNLRTGITYSSLNSAYDAAVDGDTIQSHALTFTENLTIGKAITFDGGYDCAYTSHIGTTMLSGGIDIISGTANVTLDNFDIQ